MKFDKNNLIRTVRFLPDLLIADSGILLPWNSTDNEQRKFLAHVRELHFAHADWLEYYLNDDTELSPELTFTRKVHFKMFAERTMNYYKLAQEVWIKSDIAQKNYLEPLIWTGYIEFNNCQTKIKNSYIEPITNPLGKVEQYNVVKTYYDSLDKAVTNIALSENSQNAEYTSYKKVFYKMNPLQLLEYEASRIAVLEADFRRDYYRPYLKKQKRFYAQLKNSPLKNMYMDLEKKLKIMGDGVRGKGKSKKGFQQITNE